MNIHTKRKILFTGLSFGWFVIAVALALAIAGPAKAQGRTQLAYVLGADVGWTHPTGSIGIHRPSVEFDAPFVGTWQRIARGNVYGQWEYLDVVYDCRSWTYMLSGTLDAQGNYVAWEDLTGKPPQETSPAKGSEPDKIMSGICGLYGYVRPTGPIAPYEPSIVNGVVVP